MTTPESCATSLRELAMDDRCAHRADDLKELSDAIASGESEKWVGIDLLSAFPRSTTSSARKLGLTETLLGAAAAVFVFAPVAWTWFSLHAASQAYLAMTADGVKPDDTFLGLWISGFGGHLGASHRLVPMAVVSILLIVTAAVLVIAQRIVGHAAERKDENDAVEFEARRVRVLCAAQREIGGQHAADPSAIEAIVRRSIRQLAEAHDATKDGIDRLRATTASLETATTTMTTAADAARTSSQGAENAAITLSSVVDESHRRIATTLDEFSEGVKDRLAEAQAETGRTIAQSSNAIKVAIDDLVAGVALTEKSQRLVANSIDTMDRRSVDSSSQLQGAVVDFRSAVEEVERSLHRHESAMQAQASELTAARDAVEMMLRRLEMVGNEQHDGRVDAF